jgi:hypothetical protein
VFVCAVLFWPRTKQSIQNTTVLASGSIPERIFHLFPVLKQMLNPRGGDLCGRRVTAAGDWPEPW